MHAVSASRRLAAPFTLVFALLTFATSNASASLVPDLGADCSDYSFSQVFLPWADPASYTPAPGGNFEKGNGHWTLVHAARVAGDNEPWRVGRATDHNSLSIADGGVALSPGMCSGLGEPTARMFFKQTGGLPGAMLQVDVLFDDVNGRTQAQTIAELGAVPTWTVSPQMAVMSNLLPVLHGGGSVVAFRFTAIGGSFSVDDVYVDPWNRP